MFFFFCAVRNNAHKKQLRQSRMRFITTHTQLLALGQEVIHLLHLRHGLVCASSQHQQTQSQRTAQLPRDEDIVCGELRRPTLCRPATYCCRARFGAILRTEPWFRGAAKRTKDFGFLQWPQSELFGVSSSQHVFAHFYYSCPGPLPNSKCHSEAFGHSHAHSPQVPAHLLPWSRHSPATRPWRQTRSETQRGPQRRTSRTLHYSNECTVEKIMRYVCTRNDLDQQ